MRLLFTKETLWEISQKLQACQGNEVSFEVVDPDLSPGKFNGEILEINKLKYRYRSHKAWMDLAEMLGYRYLTPEKKTYPFIAIRFQKLNQHNSWHKNTKTPQEKYGSKSQFFRIQKLEEPSFLLEYTRSLQKINIKKGMRILSLGVNRGDEFAIFKDICPPEIYQTLDFVGIDIAETAIEYAQQHFTNNHKFICADINDWPSWDIGAFDILISIGVLQSPSLNSKNIVNPLLKKFSPKNVIFGFPNARYIDGEIQFGAKSKNYTQPEWSLLLKDIGYYRRLLFRQGYKVTVTGKYYLFITGITY